MLYSGYSVIIRGNSPGNLFSFITSVIMLYEPMKRVARLHVDVSTSLFGVGLLYKFLDERDYEEDEPNTRELEVHAGRIEFRDVNFAYRPGETVLHAISFVAEAGRTTALVGRSGGGKSTVMNLILRLYEAGSGQILCDGVDIATVGLTSLRRQIAYVAQDNFLFKGSVRDNIAMGRPGASEDEIVAAAKAAYAHDFIMSFEKGYNSPCGEQGRAAFRRPAPAHRHRPRLPQGRADHPARRSDLGARFGVRAGDPEGVAHALRGPHHDRHRPPAVDGGAGRRNLRHRSRPDRRARPACRAPGAGAHLQPHRPDAVPTRRGVRRRRGLSRDQQYFSAEMIALVECGRGE